MLGTKETKLHPVQEVLEKAVDRLSEKNLSVALSSLLVTHTSALSVQKHPEISPVYGRLDEVLNRHGTNVEEHFLSILFIDLISEVEIYLATLVRAVIAKDPLKVGHFQIKLSEVLEASSKDELISRAAETYLHGVMFKKPLDYLSDISNVLSIDPNTVERAWPSYIEAKARRDLGVHNDWICNETYLRKLKEAGAHNESRIGDRLRPTTAYVRQLAESIDEICVRLASAVHEKHVGV